MNKVRSIYRVARGILFTAIILVVALYLAAYILISVPSFQGQLKGIAEREASAFLGSEISIGEMSIMPFNEVRLHDVTVLDKDGEKCGRVETLGAGISLWRLLTERRIEFSYAEIIGLEVAVRQAKEGGPLNIQYIIDAFKPKDKNKKPRQYDINLRNIVLRKCSASFDKEWMPFRKDYSGMDFNHVYIKDLKADINIPKISNDDVKIDLRRLSFKVSGGLSVQTISLRAHMTPHSLSVENFVVKLPSTELRPSDFRLEFDGYADLLNSLKEGDHHVVMVDNFVAPSDFSWLLPKLRDYTDPLTLSLDVAGNLNSLRLSKFSLESEDGSFSLDLSGEADSIGNKKNLKVIVDDVKLRVSESDMERLWYDFIVLPRNGDNEMSRAGSVLPRNGGASLPKRVEDILSRSGRIEISATGEAHPSSGDYEADCNLSTLCGDIFVSARTESLRKGTGNIQAELFTEGLDIGRLLADSTFGMTSLDLTFDGSLHGKDFNGHAVASVPMIEMKGKTYGGIFAELWKEGKEINADVSCDNEMANMKASASAIVDGVASRIEMSANIGFFKPSMAGILKKYEGYTFSGNVEADIVGNSPDNAQGKVELTDLNFFSAEKKSISLDKIMLESATMDSLRRIAVNSDWIDGEIAGRFKFKDAVAGLQCMISRVVPSIVGCNDHQKESQSDLDFKFLLKPDNSVAEFLSIPYRLLVEIPITGSLHTGDDLASLKIDIPYLQKGRDKLVRDTRLNLDIANGIARIDAATTMPAKKGDMSVGLNIVGENDNILADVNWETIDNSFLNGAISLGARLHRDELSRNPEIEVDIVPSVFEFGTAKWNIDRSNISFNDGILDVKGLKIWHEGQFIDIEGKASSSATDSIRVRLADIDVGYVFDTLNINYVTFGGIATGDLTAYGVLSKNPVASTDNLRIKEMSYNGAVLGDGRIKSHWDNNQKKVAIGAEIKGDGASRSSIDGGIWVTRDSLSFAIDADRVPVGFLQPFMSAFTSDVKGYASGKAKLFGTFSDIDLVGKILADSLSIKLDYTNVTYHGTDSVILNPGKIIIPSFRLYDKKGNSALLTGELTHRYFHDPRFNFRISDVSNMLCYDTNAKINPDWYGTFYGNGNAVVRGWPGAVSVSVDMTAVGASNFTFVLNDTQAAEDYRFLTFTDKRKEAREALKADSVPAVLAAFRKKAESANNSPSKFMIDIRGTVTPSTLMTLVMDPVAGDKITTRGNGNIQVDYDSESDEMQMFGKYTLEEGNYNFSLQDLILRDFKIRRGSSISFNGDPFNAMLDITASYRVNTNLSDLDKSFSTDKDLARTNVPVDAMLMVDGEMQHPDITFDIELPTLTQDVERKVKSIISTDDMMSRQIIYLLALNKFYTPEYMGTSGSGSELAAVASSTLSSQLSNMLGQLTDKFTLAPSFRSDKGDFSDIEVDLALSSRLLNNRLLLNGNFGYRDRSTSQTTFVGDFDLEYILSNNGNLRLKAYNHFNDQNYYLRQALTTQGLGIIYRKDFDNPFTFLRKRKKSSSASAEPIEKNDTLKVAGENADTLVDSLKESR